jgi:hypothetical protein
MKEGLFFNGVHMPCDDLAINQRLQTASLILTNAAFTPTAVFYHAAMAA